MAQLIQRLENIARIVQFVKSALQQPSEVK